MYPEHLRIVCTWIGARWGGGGGGFKPPIHFHCVLHAKRGRGGGVQKACKIAYVLNGRPHSLIAKLV